MSVCVPFGNIVLVLTENQFEEAKVQGQQLMGTNTVSPETSSNDRILDAKGMSDATGIPQSWFLEQARQKKIPFIHAGKYVRFEESKVLKHLSVKSDKRIL